jgi:hypothetical protein
MKKLGAVLVLGMLCASSAAHAENTITTVVSPDQKTVTTTSDQGRTTVDYTQTVTGSTTTTTFEPAKPAYQPMGRDDYKPTGPDGYQPMGRNNLGR